MFSYSDVCVCVFILHKFIILNKIFLILFRCSNLKQFSILKLVYISNGYFVYKDTKREQSK